MFVRRVCGVWVAAAWLRDHAKSFPSRGGNPGTEFERGHEMAAGDLGDALQPVPEGIRPALPRKIPRTNSTVSVKARRRPSADEVAAGKDSPASTSSRKVNAAKPPHSGSQYTDQLLQTAADHPSRRCRS